MNDFSDIFYLIAAIIIVSLLGMQVNRFIFQNNNTQMQSVVEENVLRVSQQFTDEVQWISSPAELDNFVNTVNANPTKVVFDPQLNHEFSFNVSVSVGDTTLPGANVSSRLVDIAVTPTDLERGNTFEIRTQMLKTFN